MKLKSILLIGGLLLSLYGYSQTLNLSGVVTNKVTNEPLSGVVVTLRPVGKNTIVKFAQTNDKGTFQLDIETTSPEKFALHFMLLGFKPQSVPLKANQSIYTVGLTEKVFNLKEVKIKSKGIYEQGDTIKYVVAKFSDIQDKTLADVLKKMPGIEVDKSGAIKYNGVAINKFYIEGKDMLEGRYGLATNNIHPEDVGSVEVMENHQPIKAMEGIWFSQNPAINVRLKEDAKTRWVGTIKAGAGFTPFLWNGTATLMRFKKISQTLNVYKTNNIGDDVTNETRAFTVSGFSSNFGKNYYLSNKVQVHPSFLSDIDAERVRFNKTHLISSNNLWSLGKNYDLTSQVTFSNNRLTSDNSINTSYFLTDSTIVTNLTEHAISRESCLNGYVTLKSNSKTFYLENKLTADFRWDNVDMDITGTYPNTQTADIKYRKVSNDLKLIKRFGKKLFTINSFNSYQVKPQKLTVIRKDEEQYQNVKSSAFYTNTNTHLDFYVKPFTLSAKVGVVGVLRSMTSGLTGISDTLGHLNNDINMRYLKLYVSPQLEYRNEVFKAQFYMPISYQPYAYTDELLHEKYNIEKLLCSPSLYLNYSLSPRLSASIMADYTQNRINEQSFYRGLILNNYQNLSQGYINYRSGNKNSVSFNIEYKNPLKVFFVNSSIVRLWKYSPRASNRIFLNRYFLNSYISQDNSANSLIVNSNISKGVDAINGVVSLQATYSNSNNVAFQNSVKSTYTSNSCIIVPRITSRITKWWNVAYELWYSKTWLKREDIAMNLSYKNISQQFSCYFNPGKQWYVKLKNEYYYNDITQDVSKDFLLTDIEFNYSFKGGWEFNLMAKNIFNKNVYDYNSYDGVTLISREYNIRPRNIIASIFFRF